MVILLCLSVVFAVYFYVDAFKSGLSPKAWGLAGLVMGPAAWPMFSISKHVAWRRSVGYGSVRIAA